jgi:hypothetical protein
MAKAIEVNIATGEVIERNMTAEELALQSDSKAQSVARDAELEAKAASKLAIYEKLGLTPDEVANLLS